MSNEDKFPARHCSDTAVTADTQREWFTHFFPLPCRSKTTTFFLASLHTFNAGTYRGGTEGPLPPTRKVMADRLWILYFLTTPSSLLRCSKISLVCTRAQKKLMELSCQKFQPLAVSNEDVLPSSEWFQRTKPAGSEEAEFKSCGFNPAVALSRFCFVYVRAVVWACNASKRWGLGKKGVCVRGGNASHIQK